MQPYPRNCGSVARAPARQREAIPSIRCGLLAALLGLWIAGCEEPTDPGTPDTAMSTASTPGQIARKAIADPRDRLLYQIRTGIPALPAQPVTHLCIDSEADLIDTFVHAYATRNYDLYASLLANVPEANASFLFLLADPTEQGETQWGLQEELRIHHRMFEPENPHPGESPVPPELWVQAIDIHLNQLSPFQERADLYSQNGGADGKLDPARWRATDARFGTNVYWDLEGQIDYQVIGEANFVVIEDLAKQSCDPGRFLIYTWEDLKAASPSAAGPVLATDYSWSSVKELYR